MTKIETRPPAGAPPGLAATGLTIRAALVIGFGVSFGLWFWSSYQLTQRMTDLERQTAEISGRYMSAQELLSNVRAQVLLAFVYTRDALLDPDPASAARYIQHFEDTYRGAERLLALYVPVLDTPDERARIAELRREIDEFHAAMGGILDIGGRRTTAEALAVFRERLFPRREVVLRVSEQVQTLNRSAYVDQRERTAALHREMERQAWRRLGFALTATLAIGLMATLYATRLETYLKQQRLRDLQLTSDLHRLSARLTSLQEDERRTIARELHDEVGQALTAIRVELALAQRAGDAPHVIAARLDQARQMAEDTLQTIRNLSHLLHPPMLDDLGLPAAIKSYLQGFSRRHGVDTGLLHEHMDARLAPEVETALYRIVQEALTNVAKHARARRCRVYLQGLTSTVLVTIEDDGTGFDPAARSLEPPGLGLISIRERTAQLGGTFQIESAPGQGTRLTVEVPARPRIAEVPPPPAEGRARESEDVTNDETANLSGR